MPPIHQRRLRQSRLNGKKLSKFEIGKGLQAYMTMRLMDAHDSYVVVRDNVLELQLSILTFDRQTLRIC